MRVSETLESKEKDQKADWEANDKNDEKCLLEKMTLMTSRVRRGQLFQRRFSVNFMLTRNIKTWNARETE